MSTPHSDAQPNPADARRRRAERLFEAAIALPREEWRPFIDDACAGDAELANQVHVLLSAHERTGGLLDRALPGDAAALLDAALGVEASQRAPRPHAMERIGAYRVVAELGRGGMGTVLLGERDDGHFSRRVAIKVIRFVDDPAILARMVAERQILAALDHPDIARLLDGGVTDDGRPYLVMEYVDGLPIDVYADRMRLTVHERLRLFARVARAVEHAHRNLIVHRDLKPSNILVAADGRVKLLDFGIAKLMNPSLAGVRTPITRTEQRVLTPEYASPEQLRGESLTPASDVYSLGVVLYRLLTGRPPYHFRDRGIEAVLTAILEADPVPPSASIARAAPEPSDDDESRPASAAEVAHDRHTTPERLRRTLQGDLDAVVLKALRKEPSGRYGSAELLAEDVERFLRGEAVLAHRGSGWYRARRFAKRHRAASVAAAGIAISLLLGAGAASWQAGVAGRARNRAAMAQADAEQSARASEEVATFLMDLFESGDPGSGSGDITARDLLVRGTERADQLADQPIVQARMLDVLGRMWYRLGQLDQAEDLLQRAVATRRQALGDSAPELAESLIHLSNVYRREARSTEARSAAEEALGIRRAAFGELHPAVGEALFELGWLSPLAQQESLYSQALDVYRRTGTQPDRQVTVLQALATNLRRQGRFTESLASDREALELATRVFGPEAPQTAYAMIHLADLVRDLSGDYVEAERLFRRGLELQIRHHGPNSTMLTHGLHSLASLRSKLGDHVEAESLYRRALTIRLAATGAQDPAYAGEMIILANELGRQGRIREADHMARDAIARTEQLLGPNHPSIASYFATLGGILGNAGRIAAADSMFDRATTIMIANGQGASVIMAEQLRSRGRMYIRARQFARAEETLQASLSIMQADYDRPDHPNVVDCRRALFELYTAWKRPTEAAKYRVPPGEFIPY